MYTYYVAGIAITDELYHDDLYGMTFGRRDQNELWHHQIKGARHGVRRFQLENGEYTPEGRRRYGIGEGFKSAASGITNLANTAFSAAKTSPEYKQESSYNSQKNSFGSNSTSSAKPMTSRTQTVKQATSSPQAVKTSLNSGKSAADKLFSGITSAAKSASTQPANQNGGGNQPYVSPEYQRDLAYNSQKNVYPEAMTKENTVPENQITEKRITENIIPENQITEKRITENIIPEKRITENTVPGNETNAESQKEKKLGLFDRIGNAASGALDSAKQWGSRALEDAGKWAGQAKEDVSNAASKVGDAASNALDSAKDWGRQAAENVSDFVNYDVTGKGYKDQAKEWENALSNSPAGTGDDDLISAPNGMQTPRWNAERQMNNNLNYAQNDSLFGRIGNAAKNAAGNVGDLARNASNLAGDAVDRARDVAGDVGNAASNAYDQAKKWASGRVEDVKGLANTPAARDIANSVGKVGDWITGNVNNDPGYQKALADRAELERNINKYNSIPEIAANPQFGFPNEEVSRRYADMDVEDARRSAYDKTLPGIAKNVAGNVADFVTGNRSRDALDRAYSEDINNGGNGDSPELDRAREAYNKTLPGMAEKAADNVRENVIPEVQERVGNAVNNVGNAAFNAFNSVRDWAKNGGQKFVYQPAKNNETKPIETKPAENGQNGFREYGDPEMSALARTAANIGLFDRPTQTQEQRAAEKAKLLSDKPSGISDEYWEEFKANGGTRSDWNRQNSSNQNGSSKIDLSDKPDGISDEYWEEYKYYGGDRDSFDKQMKAYQNSGSGNSSKPEQPVGTVDTSRPYHFGLDPKSGQTIVIYDDDKRR